MFQFIVPICPNPLITLIHIILPSAWDHCVQQQIMIIAEFVVCRFHAVSNFALEPIPYWDVSDEDVLSIDHTASNLR